VVALSRDAKYLSSRGWVCDERRWWSRLRRSQDPKDQGDFICDKGPQWWCLAVQRAEDGDAVLRALPEPQRRK
jgi:hypothetical protein